MRIKGSVSPTFCNKSIVLSTGVTRNSRTPDKETLCRPPYQAFSKILPVRGAAGQNDGHADAVLSDLTLRRLFLILSAQYVQSRIFPSDTPSDSLNASWMKYS